MRRCELCGQPADRHHIITVGAGGPDEPWNYLYLCRVHHVELHYVGRYTFAERHAKVAAKIYTACEMTGRRITDENGRRR